jgi:amino acid adenylation domain-containing protein
MASNALSAASLSRRGDNIAQRFEYWATREPKKDAVVYAHPDSSRKASYTYGELNAWASHLARQLKLRGVKQGDLVAIVQDRTPSAIAAMLGTLKVGAGYAPVNPDFPVERLKFLLDDLRPHAVILDNDSRTEWIRSDVGLQCLISEPSEDVLKSRILTAVTLAQGAEQPAYVIYTSGSTGKPKGVVVPHRGVHRLVSETNYLEFRGQAFLQTCSLVFDVSIMEIWGALLNGGSVIICPFEHVPTPALLRQVISDHGVETAWLTTSLFNAVATEDIGCLAGLKELLIGGEALTVAHVVTALKALPNTQIINGYGPTENTTFTTCYAVPNNLGSDQTAVPIGFPITGTKCAILGKDREVLPAGEIGELFTWGDGVALGYLNRDELTNEKFITINIDGHGPVRGYLTGDLARMDADGLIHFLGREDSQVKIDGHRIELGEIEAALLSIAGVKDARVIVRLTPNQQKRLVAYVVAADSVMSQLNARLKLTLPDYMVPSFTIAVDRIPTNNNGKLAVEKLPNPYESILASASHASSANQFEVLIQEIWGDILELGHKVPIDINFFDLGGTSLQAMKVTVRLGKALNRELDETVIFECPTVAKLASFLAGGNTKEEDITDARRAKRRRAMTRRH